MAKKKVRAPASPLFGKTALSLAAAKFQRAVELHQQGHLDQAETLYRDILAVQPRYFDALLLLGLLCLQTGRAQDAVMATQKAIAENSRHAGAHFNLGSALIGLGRNGEAAASFGRAVELMPAYSEAHCNRGIALQNLDRHEEAITSLDQAIKTAPGNDVAYNNRGISLQKLGRHLDAVADFDQALRLRADNGVVHNNRGISLLALYRHAEALAEFERALALVPDYAEAWFNRGLALQSLDRDDAALACFDAALRLMPENSKAYSSRGMSLLKLGRDADAMASFDQALGVAPESVEALSSRGVALQKIGRHEDALAALDQAITLKKDQADVLNHRANVLRDLNRNEEALACYAQALTLAPDAADIRFNESMCRLLLGDFEHGWEAFEWRWQTEQYRQAQRHYPQPLWLGAEPLAGKTILLHAEQGLGDTIQFCRYASLAAAQGATVILEVPPVLKPLLVGLEGVSQVLATGEARPAFDCHCPLMSLPLAFKTRIDSIPARTRYLVADPGRTAVWQARLGRRDKPRIGLAWTGNPGFGNDRHRSIRLATLVPVVTDAAQFVSLQKEVREVDAPILAARPDIAQFAAELHDFADTAALIEQLDVVIAVDTSVAHVAAALGKPVWMLLPFNSDWRWLMNRSDSPWYPSVRLFRQARLGDWEAVIDAVAGELGRLA